MVRMQMREKHLVEIVKWDTEGKKSLHGADAHVKDELVTIAQFYQKAGSGLLESRHWHT